MSNNKQRRNQRGKKPQNNRKGSDQRRNREEEPEGKGLKDISCTNQSNDVRWYANNPELLRSAASLPFSTTTGMDLPFRQKDGEYANYYGTSVPGILTAYWTPSIGGRFDDPINKAKDATYSFTVHANSRNKSYDAADEMLIILAGASLFSAIALGIRAYGIMRTFDQQNKYWPQGFIEAMGFQYNDLRDHYSQMWFDLNEVIARSRQIWVPNVFPFIERWFWMNTNIYMDSSSTKGQYYMYVPESFWEYDEDFQGNGIGGLDRITWITPMINVKISDYAHQHFVNSNNPRIEGGVGYTGKTWSDYMKMLNSMLDAMLKSQDRGIIFGDILKAYGEGNIYALQPMSVDYTTPFVYDQEVLTQFENSNAFPGSSWGIAQNPVTGHMYEVGDGYSSTSTSTSTKSAFYTNPTWKILNFHQTEVPSPEQIMVATRMACLGVAGVGKDDTIKTFNRVIPETTGTEYVHHYGITLFTNRDLYYKYQNLVFNGTQYVNDGDPVTITYQKGNPITVHTTLVDVSGDTSAIGYGGETLNASGVWMLWSAFDWAPWLGMYWTDFKVTSTTHVEDIKPAEVMKWIGDFDNYTTIDIETLKKMHATAIYSEFNVPNM